MSFFVYHLRTCFEIFISSVVPAEKPLNTKHENINDKAQSAGLTGKVNEHTCNFISWSKPRNILLQAPASAVPPLPLVSAPALCSSLVSCWGLSRKAPTSGTRASAGVTRGWRVVAPGSLLNPVLPPKGAFVKLQFQDRRNV